MALTDDEIRAIIKKERRKKRAAQKRRRRITILIILICCVALGIGLFINRDALFTEKYLGIIFIDAGHGGTDSGAVSTTYDRTESVDTLAFALQVQEELEALGFQVEMSRTTDVYVERSERGEMANEVGADLMVSIHRNQANGEGEGVEIYIGSENSEEAQILAQYLLDAMVAQGFTDRGVKVGTLTDETDDYYENLTSDMTSCLIELGFVTDEGDNALFDDYFEENAKAFAQAIYDAFIEIYPEKLEEYNS